MKPAIDKLKEVTQGLYTCIRVSHGEIHMSVGAAAITLSQLNWIIGYLEGISQTPYTKSVSYTEATFKRGSSRKVDIGD